jgi:hypothetical protein
MPGYGQGQIRVSAPSSSLAAMAAPPIEFVCAGWVHIWTSDLTISHSFTGEGRANRKVCGESSKSSYRFGTSLLMLVQVRLLLVRACAGTGAARTHARTHATLVRTHARHARTPPLFPLLFLLLALSSPLLLLPLASCVSPPEATNWET